MSTPADNLAALLAATGRAEGEPAFAAPWEADAWALKSHLVKTGRLDPSRFAAILGEELRRPHAAPEEGTVYFVAFVAALERAVAPFAAAGDLAAERAAWAEAARRTPHGEPIELQRG